MMLDFLKKMLTETDNKTPCVIKIMVLLGVLIGYGLSIYCEVVLRTHFNLQDYGIGLGACFTGAGLGMKLKPDAPQ